MIFPRSQQSSSNAIPNFKFFIKIVTNVLLMKMRNFKNWFNSISCEIHKLLHSQCPTNAYFGSTGTSFLWYQLLFISKWSKMINSVLCLVFDEAILFRGGKSFPQPSQGLWVGLKIKLTKRLTGEKHTNLLNITFTWHGNLH